MGLACTHNAFEGSYRSFRTLRQNVARIAGGSYPPHFEFNPEGGLLQSKIGYIIDTDLDERMWYLGDEYHLKAYPGLHIFLAHSDCDGEISPSDCEKVADDLTKLLPKLKKNDWGVIPGVRDGGFHDILKLFIDGCRLAASLNEPLGFH